MISFIKNIFLDWLYEKEPETPPEPTKPKRVYIKKEHAVDILDEFIALQNRRRDSTQAVFDKAKYLFWQKVREYAEEELPTGPITFDTGSGGRPYVEQNLDD